MDREGKYQPIGKSGNYKGKLKELNIPIRSEHRIGIRYEPIDDSSDEIEK